MLYYPGVPDIRQQADDDLNGFDRVIQYYMQRVDMDELKRNLAMTVEERLIQLERRIQAFEAEQKARGVPSPE